MQRKAGHLKWLDTLSSNIIVSARANILARNSVVGIVTPRESDLRGHDAHLRIISPFGKIQGKL